MGRTLKYYPSSGFLPSVVSTALFCETPPPFWQEIKLIVILQNNRSSATSQSKARMGNTPSISHPGFLFIEATSNPFWHQITAHCLFRETSLPHTLTKNWSWGFVRWFIRECMEYKELKDKCLKRIQKITKFLKLSNLTTNCDLISFSRSCAKYPFQSPTYQQKFL